MMNRLFSMLVFGGVWFVATVAIAQPPGGGGGRGQHNPGGFNNAGAMNNAGGVNNIARFNAANQQAQLGAQNQAAFRPGAVLPEFVAAQLNLSDAQRQALAVLQARVDAELAAILTLDQQAQLQQMAQGGQGAQMARGGRQGGPPAELPADGFEQVDAQQQQPDRRMRRPRGGQR